jgi:hypothetical protein
LNGLVENLEASYRLMEPFLNGVQPEQSPSGVLAAEPTPEGRENRDVAMRVIGQAILALKPRHRRVGVRVASALVGGPVRSAYETAIASGNAALADAYLFCSVGVLSNYVEESKIQGFQICALLLAKQEKGDRMARRLLDTMASVGLTGPNAP